MNRSVYFDTIEARLSWLAYRLDIRAKVNVLNLHVHSEDFYVAFLNKLFGWQLRNANVDNPNSEAIDLVDDHNRIVAQVSGTSTRAKVEHAFQKDLSAYEGYRFVFISISKDASGLRTSTIKNESKVTFSPEDDIYDIPRLLTMIGPLPLDEQKSLCDFIQKEISLDPPSEKIELNLTRLIKILANDDWTPSFTEPEVLAFKIEAKISKNELDLAETLIRDHAVHGARLEKIYSIFDQQGQNKSLSILGFIRAEYHSLCLSGRNGDDCFFAIINKVIEHVQASADYEDLPGDELLRYVEILVVDAFIRCKIFKPVVETHAHS